MNERTFQDEPCFVISVAARIVGVHAQTLRYYERVGLIWPSRSHGKQRLYSPADIERLNRIKTFTDDMGMNLAGAEVALKLTERIGGLEKQVQDLTNQLNQALSQRQPEGDPSQRSGPSQRPASERRRFAP